MNFHLLQLFLVVLSIRHKTLFIEHACLQVQGYWKYGHLKIIKDLVLYPNSMYRISYLSSIILSKRIYPTCSFSLQFFWKIVYSIHSLRHHRLQSSLPSRPLCSLHSIECSRRGLATLVLAELRNCSRLSETNNFHWMILFTVLTWVAY